MRTLIAVAVALTCASPAAAQACLGGRADSGGPIFGATLTQSTSSDAQFYGFEVLSHNPDGGLFIAAEVAGLWARPETRGHILRAQVGDAPASTWAACPVATLSIVPTGDETATVGAVGLGIGAAHQGVGAFVRGEVSHTRGGSLEHATAVLASVGAVAAFGFLHGAVSWRADINHIPDSAQLRFALRVGIPAP